MGVTHLKVTKDLTSPFMK